MDQHKVNQFAGVVAADLKQTEAAIDHAIAQVATLMNTLVTGRMNADLPAAAGQQVIAKVSEAVAAVIEGRQQVVVAHRMLEVTGKKLGVEPSLGGPFEPKPDLPKVAELQGVD